MLQLTDSVRLWWNNPETDAKLALWLKELEQAGATDVQVSSPDVLATVRVADALAHLGYSLDELSEQYQPLEATP
jgi:hypothetical protein